MSRSRTPHVRVAIAVIERNSRYLICRRRGGGHLGGYWEFPGGKKEARESWEACLRRELREELGVSVRSLRPDGRFAYGYADRRVAFTVFRCAIARGTPRPLAARALRWVTASQLTRYRFPPANRRLIRRIVDEADS